MTLRSKGKTDVLNYFFKNYLKRPTGVLFEPFIRLCLDMLRQTPNDILK